LDGGRGLLRGGDRGHPRFPLLDRGRAYTEDCRKGKSSIGLSARPPKGERRSFGRRLYSEEDAEQIHKYRTRDLCVNFRGWGRPSGMEKKSNTPPKERKKKGC